MTKLFKVSGGNLVPVPPGHLATEEQLEGWIAARPETIGLDVLVIGRQIVTDFGGRIDILGIDKDGDLTIIELKRDKTPREIVAQILDYASWIAGLTTKRVHEIAVMHLHARLDMKFRERFDAVLPENLNTSHNMVIVASQFDASSKRIVSYLAERHGVAINTAFFAVFADGAQQLMATDWLLDQDEVVERAEARTKPPWSGLWYANAGDGPHRAWDDMRQFGFLSAGGGRQYSGKLEQLQIGDRLCAYQKNAGYVGYGIVSKTTEMVRDFETAGGPLLAQTLKRPELGHDRDDPDLAEWAIGVDWKHAVPIAEARTFSGVFANQNVVCKLRHPETIEFLRRNFGVSAE